MASVSASVNLPLHHKVQKFSSGTGSPGWFRKRAVKRLWCGIQIQIYIDTLAAESRITCYEQKCLKAVWWLEVINT